MNNGFSRALKNGKCKIIADIKRVSPLYGDLLRGRAPARLAAAFERQGAPCISVVTEREHFGGGLDMLRAVTDNVKIPVLRKDFIRTEKDLRLTKECGASAVLLISSVYKTPDELKDLYLGAVDAGLEPFVETHTAEELRFALRLNAGLIGVNNKDILALERDGGTVEHLREIIKNADVKDCVLVSESGIETEDDVKKALAYGADAVLVGTALLRGTVTLKRLARGCAAR